LFRGEQNDAAYFGQAKGGPHVQRREHGFHGHGVGVKFLDEPAEQGMDIMKASASGGFLPFGSDSKSAVAQYPKIPTVGFNYPETGGAGGRRVHAQDSAEAGGFNITVACRHPR